MKKTRLILVSVVALSAIVVSLPARPQTVEQLVAGMNASIERQKEANK